MKIADIKVGRRHRKTYGDIPALAASIEAIGLLHPVVVTAEGRLVAGHRRVMAMQHLGRDEVAATVVNNLDEAALALAAERDENTCRLNFLPTEAVALGEALERIERPKARERQAKAGPKSGKGKKRTGSGKLPEPVVVGGDTRDVVGKAAGTSGKTYERAKAVVEAAKADPERFGRYADAMDKTGKVNGAYKAMQRAKTAEAISAEPPPLPVGPFRVLAIDPPWTYANRVTDVTHRAANPFPDMTSEEIASLPVATLTTKDAIVWLWTTNAHMREAFVIADAWGFQCKTILTWAKDRMGMGDWLRGQTEHCLMLIRGKPTVTLTNQTTLISGPLREHSRKPDGFYRLVESLCPGSKLELFSRENRPGWQTAGAETGAFG